MPDTDEFVHGTSSHVLRDDDGTRYTKDLAEAGLAVFIPDLGEVSLRVLEGAGHCRRWRGGDMGRRTELSNE